MGSRDLTITLLEDNSTIIHRTTWAVEGGAVEIIQITDSKYVDLTCIFDSLYVTALEDKFYLTLSYVRYRCAIIIIIIIIIIVIITTAICVLFFAIPVITIWLLTPHISRGELYWITILIIISVIIFVVIVTIIIFCLYTGVCGRWIWI